MPEQPAWLRFICRSSRSGLSAADAAAAAAGAGSCVLTSLAASAGAARPLCRDYVISDPPLPSFFHSAQPVDFGRHVRLYMRGRLCFSWMHSSSFQQVKWSTASGLKSQWRKCVYVCVSWGLVLLPAVYYSAVSGRNLAACAAAAAAMDG